MKKHFTKYLPVEGEIDRGDFVLTPEGKVHKCLETFESLPQQLSLEEDIKLWDEDQVKKVKLFLCSRDIQVGDKVYNDGEVYEIKNPSALEFAKKFNDFKIIGEISPNAKWVKEGDEFDREDLKIWKSCDSYSSKIITEAFGGVWTHEEDRIITPGKVKKVEVKCPCCETFK